MALRVARDSRRGRGNGSVWGAEMEPFGPFPSRWPLCAPAALGASVFAPQTGGDTKRTPERAGITRPSSGDTSALARAPQVDEAVARKWPAVGGREPFAETDAQVEASLFSADRKLASVCVCVCVCIWLSLFPTSHSGGCGFVVSVRELDTQGRKETRRWHAWLACRLQSVCVRWSRSVWTVVCV